ncbi:MAG TPA: tetratricopeptide repeat protein [Verrucomicrobiae bacterium]|nr:tetratricopeptide repeat protein [Verrucomicrobiae bacterium]
MDAVSYPQQTVVEFVTSEMVPLRIAASDETLTRRFNVTWTPTTLVLCPDGSEHYRSVGFLPPDELVPSLMLGIARAYFEGGRSEQSLNMLERLLARHPRSAAAPEAVFLQGVVGYKTSHDAAALKGAHRRLQTEYPQSEWTKRAEPYGLLP